VFDYRAYITRNLSVCGGAPVMAGTRVPLKTVLASLAEGDSIDDIVADFPSLTPDAVRAAIMFAAASAEEDIPPLPLPEVA
jgi:uncharacterized protein (DUF433 family)